MPNLTPRKPSAAMLVAVTALVSSLAGPAVADEVAQVAQSITSSKQIKNGSVTGADVKNNSLTTTDLLDGSVQSADIGTGQVDTSELAPNSVRGDKIPANTIDGSDIQDGSVDGRDIELSTLGRVPSADKVGNLSASDLVTQDERLSFQRKMNKGDARIVLDRFGAFTIYGTCEDNAGSTRARIIATTSEPHSYVSAWDTDDDFNPGEENMIVEADSTSDNYDYGYEIYGMYSPSSERVVIDDDGQSTAVLVNTRGADCRFFSDR